MTMQQGTPLVPNEILLVEDDGVKAMTITQTLARLGFKVCGVVKPDEEAFAAAARLNPDLVLIALKRENLLSGIDAALQFWRQQKVPAAFLVEPLDEPTRLQLLANVDGGLLIEPIAQEELNQMILSTLLRSAHSERKKPSN